MKRFTGSLPMNTIRQASVAEKKPETFYWKLLRPLNLQCGFSLPVAHTCALSTVQHTSRLIDIQCALYARLGGLAPACPIIDFHA